MITSCDTTRVDIISMESIDTEKLAQAENELSECSTFV